MPPKITVEKPSEFLQEARDRYASALDDVKQDHADAKLCVKFIHGGDGQWSQEALESRRPKGKSPRPVITWNLLQEPVNQVINDSRAMKPAIETVALDGGTPETADFFQSRIRAIEYESDADIAYDTSAQQQIINGFGFYRVRTDYKDYRSFDQKIIIEEIQNPFSALCDIAARKYDKSDADWWFVHSRISEKEFIRKHGKTALDEFVRFNEGGDVWLTQWKTGDELIPEVEYWVREWKKAVLYRVMYQGQPTNLLDSELKKYGLVIQNQQIVTIAQDGQQPIPIQLLDVRDTAVPTVKQYLIDGAEILDEHDWLGTIIPIIPVYGPQMIVDGRRRTKGLINDALDPQRIVNYTVSRIAELTSQISNTKWTVAEGAITEDHAEEWQANSQLLWKTYKMYDSNGRQLEKPIPDTTEPPIQALTMQLAQAIDAVKKATAIFSASLGDRSNETSGKAINARKIESDAANFHFQDNQARSRKKLGRILVELIPILDAQQGTVSIRSEDGKSEMVPINKPFKGKEGKPITYEPGKGNYDVGVRTGPSYMSQRQEAAETYGLIAQKDPTFMGIAGDLYFRNLDAPGADMIADRYEQKIIPPEFRKSKDGAPQLPPEAIQALQKSQQSIAALNEYAKTLEAKLQEVQSQLDGKLAEMQARKEMVEIQETTKREIALAQLTSKEGIELLRQDIASLKHSLEMAQADRMAAEQAERQAAQVQASRTATSQAQGATQ